MVAPNTFLEALTKAGIRFFAGVPDSLLKEFCLELTNVPDERHVIAANEGNAVALASGWHLATGTPGLVYMQNSGLGNAVNPLISLADPAVYGIPMLLMIGWRGEPDVADEPQHVRQGSIMLDLLSTLGIPFEIMPTEDEEAERVLASLLVRMQAESRPVALIVRKGTFATCSITNERPDLASLSREEALEQVIDMVGVSPVIATTGMLARELFELREKRGETHNKDFLTVGSMGHASQIALGIALALKEETVYCLDGDGALLMHMGALATIGNSAPKNLRHIVFNNEAHDSVGGQPTAAGTVDLPALALACGYVSASCADSRDNLVTALDVKMDGPSFLEVRVKRGARSDLGRPTETPRQSAEAFKRSFVR